MSRPLPSQGHIDQGNYKFVIIRTLEKPLQAVFPDVVTKLSKLLDPAHVTPRVKLCIPTMF